MLLISTSCKDKNAETKEEQLSVGPSEGTDEDDSSQNSLQGNVAFNQLITNPNSVVLTGNPRFRLVTVYKFRSTKNSGYKVSENSSSYSYSSNYEEEELAIDFRYFMPGIDVLYGYNLVNVAHYDMEQQKTSFLFKKPVLIKTLYFPGVIPDSLNKKPVKRNYFLVSVYDEDSNKDTLINKKNLRRFYYFDEANKEKKQLIPANYSAIRSQYDSQNDVMYLFARQDVNKNGSAEKNEPIHIFWFSLNTPILRRDYIDF